MTFVTHLFAIVAVLLVVPLYIAARKQGHLPPRPQWWPLIGNALDMPREKEWLVFTEWEKTYGDVVSLSIFGRTIIILNSAKAAIDLLHKRSSIYSDRPYLAMGGEMVGYNGTLILTRYGGRFRQMRRLMHQILGPRPAQLFWIAVEQETTKFLNRLSETPEQFVDHIRHNAGAIILKISHGYMVSETKKDSLVALAERALEEFSLLMRFGEFWVDFLPWLKYVPSWFPGAGFHGTATEWRKDLLQMSDTAHAFTKDQMANGTAVPSFTSKLLQEKYSPETENLVKWTAFSIYAAGADTTVSAITTFFLAICLHPHVQVTAQAELDTVVGNGRLPTMADRSSLPYINAIMKEVLRWGPVAPIGCYSKGALHQLTEEDEYHGYRIPAGSIVISNIWGITHNPETYPKPYEFRPERFLTRNEVAENPLTDPLQLVFGFGRRVCPGQHLVEPSLFLAIAMTLATFSISKAHDEKTGKIIDPTAEWMPGAISHPKPFRCQIKPRSTGAINVIKQAVGEGGA